MIKAGSGRGKTTLLSILFGTRIDYQGGIFFDQEPIRQLGHHGWSLVRRRRLSCVFQDLQLFDDLSALANIQIKNRLTGHKTGEEIHRFFEMLGLEDKIESPVWKLSRGQKQRVAIIRALCQPFEFLLLDEPFSHLDLDNRLRTAAAILAECSRQQAGILFASLDDEPSMQDCSVINL